MTNITPLLSARRDLDDRKSYRRKLAAGGHVHVDRPLPFLMLHRHSDLEHSLARRLATISAANVVWPDHANADAEAASNVSAIVRQQQVSDTGFLLVSLYDLPLDLEIQRESPRLAAFRFVLAASPDAPAQAAAKQLKVTLESICVELREPTVVGMAGDAGDSYPDTVAGVASYVSWLSLGIPQIYRVPGDQMIYPQIFHQLEIAVYDALLRAVAAFVATAGPEQEAHSRKLFHRSFARRGFIQMALQVDQELGRINASFDFLLGLSPINSSEAFQQFRAGKCQSKPVFQYRPLTVDPDVAKRELYAIDIETVEDPVLEALFSEKQRELDQQLMMLQRRNSASFRYASLLQYGGVETALLEQARAILELLDERADRAPRGKRASVDCHAIQAAAEAVLARYRHKVPAFESARVMLREDIPPGLMVSGTTLLISTAARIPRSRLDALLQHEISVHLLTRVNGDRQGLSIFGAGLADYEAVQEGLGVFAELAVNGLSVARMRLLAARVLVVAGMLDGASFIDCYRLLCGEHRFKPRAAFNLVARVYRSGGLTKDAIYLRGINQVIAFVASGKSLDPFWFGKIAERHVPVVHELRARGMLREPAATPQFLRRPEARRCIERIRNGEPLSAFLRVPTT